MAHKGTPPTPPKAILRPEDEDACFIHLQEMDHIPPVVMDALRLAGIRSYKRLRGPSRRLKTLLIPSWIVGEFPTCSKAML